MTPDNLYNYYQQLIKNDDLDIYVLGDFDPEEMKSKIGALIKRDKQHSSPVLQPNSPAVKQQEKPQVVIEKQNIDRKSTRLNSSHVSISYAVFCLKKKK